MKRRLRRFMPRPAPLALSIMLVLTVVVPIAVVVMPHIHRWWRIAGLTSADEARQQRSLGYVIANADDPRVLRGIVDHLDTPDDQDFTQLVVILDSIGRWDRPTAGDDAWLRWLDQLTRHDSPAARIAAAQHLANLYALADAPRVVAAVDRLIKDDDADVRLNALVAAAELYGASEGHAPYEAMIAHLTADPQPAIARDAWLLLGLIDPISGRAADWSTAAPEVAEAIVFAAAHTNPDHFTLPDTAPPPLPAIAAAARANEPPRPTLDDVDFPDTLAGYYPWFTSPLSTVRDVAALEASLRFPPQEIDQYLIELLNDYNDQAKMSAGILAGLTGLQPDLLRKRHDRERTAQVKQVLRLGLWMQGDDTIIDLPTAQALLAREDFESRSTVLLAMLHVGQRRPPAPRIARAALDFLLNPRGEPTIDLDELFDTLRWWRIMEFELPRVFAAVDETNLEGPRFWVWAEPAVQRLQIDVLRNWYLLHRHKLRG